MTLRRREVLKLGVAEEQHLHLSHMDAKVVDDVMAWGFLVDILNGDEDSGTDSDSKFGGDAVILHPHGHRSRDPQV
ncbi:hypothetical protein NDU88_005224 [Pleurodeles waltl]|uniref:Uncharacterized protein n=1 Tax=Pleurodeles waltl TaxID=8319 RepID=A0AAV7PEX1_PLEWA|nr:hypothetical protein NDU88_005224 [Pleurodeles waltl]